MEKRILLTFVTVLLFSYYTRANKNHLGFGFDNEQISETIPFTSYKNLIIVRAVLDGQNELNLILDTGIRSLVLFEKAYVPEITHAFNIEFTAAGEPKPISAIVSAGHTLRLSDDVVANQINSVILDRFNPYLGKLKGIKIHGAFGYQLFSRFQVKIDYRNQLITLSEPSTLRQLDGFESIPITIHDTKPFVQTQFLTRKHRWKKLNLLVDLGGNHKVLLLEKQGVSNLFHHVNSDHRIAEGLSSSIYGSKAVTDAIRLGSMQFPNVELLIPEKSWYHQESMDIEKNGSIGGRLFKDSIIVLDYINSLLFIEYEKPLFTETNGVTSNQ